MRACEGASASRKLPMVLSENTTPQPKVSSGRLRSNISTDALGSAFLNRIAEYRPAGPPPMQKIRFMPNYIIYREFIYKEHSQQPGTPPALGAANAAA